MDAQKNLDELLRQRQELDKLISDTRKMAAKMDRLSKARAGVIRDIAGKMIEYQIKTEDVDAAVKALMSSGGLEAIKETKKSRQPAEKVSSSKVKAAKTVKPAKKAAKGSKGVLAPKYRDPASGKTWSGRGLQPLWFRDALNRGVKPEDLEIQRTPAR